MAPISSSLKKLRRCRLNRSAKEQGKISVVLNPSTTDFWRFWAISREIEPFGNENVRRRILAGRDHCGESSNGESRLREESPNGRPLAGDLVQFGLGLAASESKRAVHMLQNIVLIFLAVKQHHFRKNFSLVRGFRPCVIARVVVPATLLQLLGKLLAVQI